MGIKLRRTKVRSFTPRRYNSRSNTVDTSLRVKREQEFHDALIRDGSPTIATKEWWETLGGKVRFERRISMLRKACTSVNNPRILIIGCGDGEWINEISKFAFVTGVDISSEIIKSVGQRVQNRDLVRVEVGDVHNLRFDNAEFDICFANSVLHHLELPVAIPEICRVLRPGGRLIAGEPNQWNPQVWWMYRSKNRSRYGLTPDEEAFSRISIRALLQPHFARISVLNFDFWHPSFGKTHEESLIFRLILLLERIPFIKNLSGSLWIIATKI